MAERETPALQWTKILPFFDFIWLMNAIAWLKWAWVWVWLESLVSKRQKQLFSACAHSEWGDQLLTQLFTVVTVGIRSLTRTLMSAVELSSTGIVWYSNFSGQWFLQFGETFSKAVIPNLSSSSSWLACAADPKYKSSSILTGTPWLLGKFFWIPPGLILHPLDHIPRTKKGSRRHQRRRGVKWGN